MRGEPFVSDQLENDFFVRQPRALFDGAFDRVTGDGAFARFLDRRRKARIEIRISAPELGGDDDFADKFDDHLAALLRVGFAARLFPLCAQFLDSRIHC